MKVVILAGGLGYRSTAASDIETTSFAAVCGSLIKPLFMS